MKILLTTFITLSIIFLSGCKVDEEHPQVTEMRSTTERDKNDPLSVGYLDNHEPFSADIGDGFVYFKGEEDEVD